MSRGVVRCVLFLLMVRRPPRSTRTDTLFPYTTLCRSDCHAATFAAGRGYEHACQSPARRRTAARGPGISLGWGARSEEHTSELQSLMRISYAVFCLKKKNVGPCSLSSTHESTCTSVSRTRNSPSKTQQQLTPSNT